MTTELPTAFRPPNLTTEERDGRLTTRKIEDTRITERYVRCTGEIKGFPCNKILTKIFVITDSLDHPGLEIKFGTETKCNRCKHLEYTLNTI